jgi:hypothetical protein
VERKCGHRIFCPAGQGGISPVGSNTIAVEDDSDAVSPRTRSATQLAFDGVWRLRPARGGPARRLVTDSESDKRDTDDNWGANETFSFVLWRWVVVAGAVSLTALAYSGQSTSEGEKNDDDSDVVSKIMWKSTSTATLSVR